MSDSIIISTHERDQLSPAQQDAIWELHQRVWPEVERKTDADGKLAELTDGTWHVAWLGDRPVATSCTFSRTILFPGGELEVMALASVCVHPDQRGTGLGARMVRLAFRDVESGRYPLSLYQTGVPDFYDKLGARTVDNRFWDSTDEDSQKNPWWEPHIMIYPASADWPDGPIDLNGRGY